MAAPDIATLRDTVVTDPDPQTTPSPELKSDPELTAPKLVSDASPEAAEIARILTESNISKDQLNDLLQAPRTIEALRYQIQNDPKAFLQQLERTDPQSGERFLEAMADTYVDRFGNKKTPSGKSDNATDDTQTEAMRQVEQLRAEISRLTAKDQQRDAAAFNASLRQRYDARVDDVFGMDAVKKLGLPASEVKNMKARLWNELSSDQTSAQRVNSGNFVDVPRVLQSLLEEKVADRKAAIEAEKKGRERVQSNSFFEFPNGPDPAFMQSLDPKTFDSWEGTEDGFAKALERTGR